jgi:hypothetical protein
MTWRMRSNSTNLVVSPTQHHIIQTTVRLVNTVFRGVYAILGVRVPGKGVRVNDLVGEFTANNKGVLQFSRTIRPSRTGEKHINLRLQHPTGLLSQT